MVFSIDRLLPLIIFYHHKKKKKRIIHRLTNVFKHLSLNWKNLLSLGPTRNIVFLLPFPFVRKSHISLVHREGLWQRNNTYVLSHERNWITVLSRGRGVNIRVCLPVTEKKRNKLYEYVEVVIKGKSPFFYF